MPLASPVTVPISLSVLVTQVDTPSLTSKTFQATLLGSSAARDYQLGLMSGTYESDRDEIEIRNSLIQRMMDAVQRTLFNEMQGGQ